MSGAIPLLPLHNVDRDNLSHLGWDLSSYASVPVLTFPSSCSTGSHMELCLSWLIIRFVEYAVSVFK
jgi:hypothetical protein